MSAREPVRIIKNANGLSVNYAFDFAAYDVDVSVYRKSTVKRGMTYRFTGTDQEAEKFEYPDGNIVVRILGVSYPLPGDAEKTPKVITFEDAEGRLYVANEIHFERHFEEM